MADEVEIIWSLKQVYEFQGSLDYFGSHILGLHEGDYETYAEYHAQVKRELEDLEEGWRMKSSVAEALMDLSNENNWFDADSSDIEIRRLDIIEGDDT